MDEHQFERVLRRAELIRKYMGLALTDEEKRELQAWIDESEDNRAMFTELTRPAILSESLRRFYSANTAVAYEELQHKIFPKPQKKLRRQWWILRHLKQSAAAFCFTAIFVTVVFQIGRTRISNPFTVLANFAQSSNKTYLMLRNGYPFALDELPVGAFVVDGPVKVVKLDRQQISYQPVKQSKADADNKQAYHALATPRSGSQEINFANGSKMLLMPGSVIQYPIVEGESKTLLIAGEARFTAAPGSRPLIVTPETKLLLSNFSVMGHAHLRITINTRTNVMTLSTNAGYRIVTTVDRDTGHIKFAAVSDGQS